MLAELGLVAAKKLRASNLSLRTNSNAEPWKLLVPDLVRMLTTPPAVRPVSAV